MAANQRSESATLRACVKKNLDTATQFFYTLRILDPDSPLFKKDHYTDMNEETFVAVKAKVTEKFVRTRQDLKRFARYYKPAALALSHIGNCIEELSPVGHDHTTFSGIKDPSLIVEDLTDRELDEMTAVIGMLTANGITLLVSCYWNSQLYKVTEGSEQKFYRILRGEFDVILREVRSIIKHERVFFNAGSQYLKRLSGVDGMLVESTFEATFGSGVQANAHLQTGRDENTSGAPKKSLEHTDSTNQSAVLQHTDVANDTIVVRTTRVDHNAIVTKNVKATHLIPKIKSFKSRAVTFEGQRVRGPKHVEEQFTRDIIDQKRSKQKTSGAGLLCGLYAVAISLRSILKAEEFDEEMTAPGFLEDALIGLWNNEAFQDILNDRVDEIMADDQASPDARETVSMLHDKEGLGIDALQFVLQYYTGEAVNPDEYGTFALGLLRESDDGLAATIHGDGTQKFVVWIYLDLKSHGMSKANHYEGFA